MNGDMGTGANFLDDGGDDDLEMDENGGVTSKHMKSLENLFESLMNIVKTWWCLGSILLAMT